MITAILFDWGGVLAPADNELAARRLQQKYGGDFQRLKQKIGEYEKGCSSTKNYFPFLENIHREFGISAGDVMAALLDTPPGKGFETAKKFIGRFKLGILSNQMHFKSKQIKETYDLSFFDPVLFSCELGVQKPAEKAFQIALDKLRVRAEDCLFIDDNTENIIAAEKFGFRGLLCTDVERLEEAINNLVN